MLGRYFSVKGVIASGTPGEGRVGLPTACLQVVDPCTLPAKGVYAVYVATDAGVYRAVANIGRRAEPDPAEQAGGQCPTPMVEVHLLDFAGDLQAQQVRIQFAERLRDERQFVRVDELSKQIRQDIARAKELL
jgi:riboflavin kinase/FMN adenylyltransferase